jgi:hypothetical protein
MEDEVFSKMRPPSSDSGRVVVVSSRPTQVRFRSVPFWAGCHWLGQSVLCAGTKCPACAKGHPKRGYAFSLVDVPQQGTQILRMSVSDFAKFVRPDPSSALELDIGDVFEIRREKERVPLTVRFLKSCQDIIELSQEQLVLEVLRLHRIQATHADVRERAYWGLIHQRCLETCGGQRSLIH